MSDKPADVDEVRRHFDRAKELAEADREAYLNENCGDNPELLEQLARMLEFIQHGVYTAETEPCEGTAVRLDESELKIEGYEVIRKLDSGGMGTVYLARRERGNVKETVAIKVMGGGGDDPAAMQSRFEQERQMLCAVKHQNIAAFIDAGQTVDGRPYFVMEYVDGLPLDVYCDRHRLSIDERLRIFQGVCSAVDCVNRHTIVHRDLKPMNILVRADGRPVLLDFGIAKFLSPDLANSENLATTFQSRVMTPAFASPEQIQGTPLTTASDVYSLGVILYQLLCGQTPYMIGKGDPQPTLVKIICERDPVLPSQRLDTTTSKPGADVAADTSVLSRNRRSDTSRLRRQLHGDLDQIVMQAMRKEPGRRYQSAKELSDDIERYLTGHPVQASPDSLTYRMGKFVRRNRGSVIAASIAAFAVFGGLAGTTMGYWEAREARDDALVAYGEARESEQRVRGQLLRYVELAEQYTGDLDTALESLHGGFDVRQDFARSAQELLEGAIESCDGYEDPDAQLMLARIERRLGSLRGGPHSANQGDGRSARALYEQAHARAIHVLGGDPENSEAKRQVARAELSLVNLDYADRNYTAGLRRAQAARERLEEVQKTQSTIRSEQELSEAVIQVARLLRKVRDSSDESSEDQERTAAEVREGFEAAVRMREGLLDRVLKERSSENERIDAEMSLTVAQLKLAAALERAGNLEPAEQLYRDAYERRHRIHVGNGGNVKLHRRWLDAAMLWAQHQSSIDGRRDAALRLSLQILEDYQDLRRLNPMDRRFAKGEERAQRLVEYIQKLVNAEGEH